MPDFTYEKTHHGKVCGLDEVGRGPCAGPVIAACVYIPEHNHPLWKEINDSKKITKKKREDLTAFIKKMHIGASAKPPSSKPIKSTLFKHPFLP